MTTRVRLPQHIEDETDRPAISQMVFWNSFFWYGNQTIPFNNSLKIVSSTSINNQPILVQKVALGRTDDTPLYKQLIASKLDITLAANQAQKLQIKLLVLLSSNDIWITHIRHNDFYFWYLDPLCYMKRGRVLSEISFKRYNTSAWHWRTVLKKIRKYLFVEIPDQRKFQTSVSLAFVRGIPRWLVNPLTKGQ